MVRYKKLEYNPLTEITNKIKTQLIHKEKLWMDPKLPRKVSPLNGNTKSRKGEELN
jgi:hypothetical protein